MYSEICKFIKNIYKEKECISLHEPIFLKNEEKYVVDAIRSTFVSSVGKYVVDFENGLADYVGAKYAIATMNGTSALHIALVLSGVNEQCEVITQSLTFIATANAITYTGAKPVFVDVDLKTLGLCPEKLESFLGNNCKIVNRACINQKTGKRIKACIPMHTFGHPVEIDKIVAICDKYFIDVIEDSAESLGSLYKGKHTGTFGKFGVFSFNGNKVITAGNGGMIVTNDEKLAKQAKHITTTAKVPHSYEFRHDQIGFNYRLSNLSSALGLAQLEQLDFFLNKKREIANRYRDFFKQLNLDVEWVAEPANSNSNYWLNALLFKEKEGRDRFLKETNEVGVMTRPIWVLMSKLDIYKDCQSDDLVNSIYLEDRIVNIPSGVVV